MQQELDATTLTDIRDKAPDPFANACFIGPTAVDLSLMRTHAAPKETALLASWRADDLSAFYRQQRANKYH